MPRPDEALAMRARFDLRIEMELVSGRLVMRRIPIAVDDTPLRIRGKVGTGLYRSARAAGATPQAIQTWLRVIGKQMPLSNIRATDESHIILASHRAAKGETENGYLQQAGAVRRGKTKNGREQR